MKFHHVAFRWVGRVGRPYLVLRLLRLTWRRGEIGDGGYSAKVSLALRPRMWEVLREFKSYSLTVLGVRVHFSRSYGGYYDA